MAIGKYTDFKIYEEEFYGGMNDVIARNADAFNGPSNNAIRLVRSSHVGNFLKEAYYTQIASLVARRDITSTSAATDKALGSDEVISPKLARGFLVGNTLDSLKKIGASPQEMSFVVGQQVGQAKMVDWLDTLLTCGVTAVGKTAASFYNKGSNAANTMQYNYLIEGMKLMGDQSRNLAAWVMHSKAYFDLMKTNISVATDRVAGATIYEGTTGTLGLPVVVTDSASLINTDGVTSGTDSYYCLGLVENGLAALESEETTVVSDIVTGLANLVYRVQGEHSFDASVKGISYTDTGVNPASAALATASNWTLKRASIKSAAGILIEHA